MTLPDSEIRLACRDRPLRRAAMFQQWRRLLFVHWAADPGLIQQTLPPGLTVDTWEGRAYVGLVPFAMQGIRPAFLPSLPWISNCLEMNVRTYVHDATGRPGVWFYSLDCNQPVAVALARVFFGLPYFRARISSRQRTVEQTDYTSVRGHSGVAANLTWHTGEPLPTAAAGSFEFFLVERYFLFALRRERLLRGQVHHAPYPLQTVKSLTLETKKLTPAGPDYTAAPAHIIASPGVDVEIFRPELI